MCREDRAQVRIPDGAHDPAESAAGQGSVVEFDRFPFVAGLKPDGLESERGGDPALTAVVLPPQTRMEEVPHDHVEPGREMGILEPRLRSVLRIVAAFIFIQSGTMKLFAFPMGMPPDGGTAELMTQTGIGGLLEVVGGALVLLGLFTRPTAFVLSGEMAVAYFQFHAPQSFWTVINGGYAAVLYCFLWLYLSAAGAGPWSLDAWRKKRRS